MLNRKQGKEILGKLPTKEREKSNSIKSRIRCKGSGEEGKEETKSVMIVYYYMQERERGEAFSHRV